jgi:hypothetical protein
MATSTDIHRLHVAQLQLAEATAQIRELLARIDELRIQLERKCK